ncbi:S8 family serine peptidase [Idiomarina sp. PL1-037]|uniref:S8 family serine peptidase n=1 Tax=Idiomarina sp. PL1-037 TaxID=3095365 RepID=UPI002ACC17BA|nr:S8 family serine peptidase [Idiomarina sp. PL1-037]WQC52930.1 S8 family serine peptidase [Idiomarina sp. PL1-037]
MKKLSILTLSALAVSVSAAYAKPPEHSQAQPLLQNQQQVESDAPQRYIIKFKNNGNAVQKMGNRGRSELAISRASNTVKKAGGQIKLSMRHNLAVAAELSAKQKKRLEKNPNIEYIEVDHKRRFMAQDVPYGISQVQANLVDDSVAAATAGGKKICVIDSGLELPHEDMGIRGGTITGTNDSGTGNWHDNGGPHGTHVAGTIAALDNGLGVRGVIGSNPNLHIVKVFNSNGWGYSSSLVSAIETCADNGADVVNMSLGGGGSNQTEANAMQNLYNQGVLLVAAAGNDGSASSETDSMSYPASYNAVVSVAAIDNNKQLAGFSQKNSQVEIAGPGVNVLSTYPEGTGQQGNYGTMSGTSMASPHVAGVAALVWSHHPSCSAQEIRSVLNTTAQDLGPAGRDVQFGYGLAQTKDAVDYIDANGCDGSGGGGGGDPEPPTDNELANGQTVSDLSATTGDSLYYTLDVPAGATDLSFSTNGGSGDADLYVRFGSEPTQSSYDCRPYESGNTETCTISNVQAGTYYVMVNAYSSFSGVNLTGSFTEPSSGGGGEGDSVSATDLSGNSGEWTHYYVDIPAGISSLDVTMSGGSGDADLYVRRGSQPTESNYECRPYRSGSNETCNIESPSEDRWYISLKGYTNYSGVDLLVEWE